MAIGGDAATQLASLLLPMVTNKKQTGSVTPQVTNNFNSLMSSLIPQAQNNLASQGDLDALLQSIMSQASRSFAPNKAAQNSAGMYNSSSLDFMRNDASAKATEQAMQAMMAAKLQGQQNQLQAAQLAGGMNSQMGQLTGTQTTPAALGSLAGPAAAYALYKFMQPEGAKTASTVGKLGDVTSSATATSQATGGANKLSLAAPAASAVGTSSLGFDYGAPAGMTLGGADKAASMFGASDLAATSFDIGDGLGDLSTAFSDLSSGAGTVTQLGGTADSVSNITGGGYDLLGNLVGGVSDFVGGIPIVGESLVNIGGQIGEAASGISDFFTPEVNIPGFGPTGIPILAGLGNFMEGDYLQGVGDIGATAALSAIPVVGPALALISGFTSNGILDDWFGIEDCYITTAVTKATGGPDDAYELETLRKYRDEFMKATPAGKELIQNYYDVAPKVVAKLSAREDGQEIYNYFYHRYIVPAVKQIEAGDNYGALTTYREMSQFAESVANMKEGN